MRTFPVFSISENVNPPRETLSSQPTDLPASLKHVQTLTTSHRLTATARTPPPLCLVGISINHLTHLPHHPCLSSVHSQHNSNHDFSRIYVRSYCSSSQNPARHPVSFRIKLNSSQWLWWDLALCYLCGLTLHCPCLPIPFAHRPPVLLKDTRHVPLLESLHLLFPLPGFCSSPCMTCFFTSFRPYTNAPSLCGPPGYLTETAAPMPPRQFHHHMFLLSTSHYQASHII